jgi:hypothetical protein
MWSEYVQTGQIKFISSENFKTIQCVALVTYLNWPSAVSAHLCNKRVPSTEGADHVEKGKCSDTTWSFMLGGRGLDFTKNCQAEYSSLQGREAYVVRWMVSDVSKDCSAFIFRVGQSENRSLSNTVTHHRIRTRCENPQTSQWTLWRKTCARLQCRRAAHHRTKHTRGRLDFLLCASNAGCLFCCSNVEHH